MTPNFPFVAVAAGILFLAPPVNASSGIFDRTQLLFAAPAFMLPGQIEVPMMHAHLIYLGAEIQDPAAPVVEYSYGQLDNGVLDYNAGFNNGIYVTLERPPAELVPPYHLIGLAVVGLDIQPGGLLIGGSHPSLWEGLDFNSIFPGINLRDVVTQLRSGTLSGGAIEDLVTEMVLNGGTLQSEDPMPVPENQPGLLGWVWGFDYSGSSVELGVLIDDVDPGWPGYIGPIFGMFPLEPTIIPEPVAAPGSLACLALAVGGCRRRNRRGQADRSPRPPGACP